jgi:hypothetical protein
MDHHRAKADDSLNDNMKPIKSGKKGFVSAYNPRGFPTDAKGNPWPEPEKKKPVEATPQSVPQRKAA